MSLTSLGEVVMSRTLGLGGVITADGAVSWHKDILFGRNFPATKPENVLDGFDNDQAWLVWVLVALNEKNEVSRYKGVATFELSLENKHKSIPTKAECIHLMAEAAKGKLILENLPEAFRKTLAETLEKLSQDAWDKTEGSIKGALMAI